MSSIEDLLYRLSKAQKPTSDAKDRVYARIRSRLQEESPLFHILREGMNPDPALKARIRKRVTRSTRLPAVEALEEIRSSLLPAEGLGELIRRRILLRLTPAASRVTNHLRLTKWAASFALIAILVRLSPALFIASPTVAESQVLLLPTRGNVALSVGSQWQTLPFKDLALEPGMMLKTGADSEASILLRDDGVVRLGQNTVVGLHDLSDRLEPASEIFPTLTLYSGTIWVQGLIPERLRGITVATSYGFVTVNEGSVSLSEGDTVEVEVYDRRAVVMHDGQEAYLAAGERTSLWEGNILLTKKIPEKWYQREWPSQNLSRDSVHRHDIAQLQHERRVAAAGILPTSPLYPVKRVAEAVDVFLTFGEEARVEKKLHVAQTRLNEASALITEGEEEVASVPLEEYREMVRALGDGSLSQFLAERAIAELTADVAASLPGDESYPIKRTVLEASRDLPVSLDSHVDGELLLDALTTLALKIEDGKTEEVRSLWNEMQPYLTAFESGTTTFSPALHKEAQTMLAFIASSLSEMESRGAEVDAALLDDIAVYLPAEKGAVAVLSEEEIMAIVSRIKEKVFIYDMEQSRINQLVSELRVLDGHPDLGRILRRLAQVLPEGPERFTERIYKEIVRLRWERASEGVI